MVKNLLSNWTLIRAIRLILGLIIVIQGLIQKDYLFAFLGMLFAVLAFANIGCCGTSGCNSNIHSFKKKEKEVQYEEVN